MSRPRGLSELSGSELLPVPEAILRNIASPLQLSGLEIRNHLEYAAESVMIKDVPIGIHSCPFGCRSRTNAINYLRTLSLIL